MRRRAALAAVLLVLTGCSSDPGAPATGGSDIVAAAPNKLGDALRELRGKPVVVNFWATWCEPCKAEMPRIVRAARKYKDDVAFLGVNVEDDTDAAARFAERYDVPFRSISDTDGAIRRDEKVLGLPVTQFYSSDGELAFVHQGEIGDDDLEEKIAEVLALD